MYIVNSNEIADKRLAIETAYRLDMLSVYDTVNNNTILLPIKQRSGTVTQQKAYLTSVVDRLCK